MKRVIFLLATFLLAFGICLSASAQNEVRVKGLETSSEKAHGECRFTIDYVTTDNEMFNMAMNLHLREWINQLVSKRLEKPMERMKTSNAKEMEAYIKQSAETVATSLSEEWEEFLKDQEEDSFYRDMKQSEGLVVALLEDQPRYVCMSRVSSGFYGGAHGFASYLHYVIRKSDGKIIEPFRDDKVEELGDYIYARLCKDDLGGLDVDMMESAEEISKIKTRFPAPTWICAWRGRPSINNWASIAFALFVPQVFGFCSVDVGAMREAGGA